MFHAFLSAVVATPVPTPSPEVIKQTLQTIVQPIAQTPAVTEQLITLGATAGAAIVASIIHQLVTKGKNLGNINRVIVALYTTAIALGSAFTQGQLHFDPTGWVTIVVSLAVALAAALGRFEFWQFVTNIVGKGNATEASVVTALAADAPVEPTTFAG